MQRGLLKRAFSSLFVLYAVASLVPVALLGAVLLQGYQQEAVERGLEQGRAQTAVIQEMAIAPSLGAEDLAEGLTEVQRARLQTATDLAIYSGSVARLRLRSFSGLVTFSDDGSTAGALPSSHPASACTGTDAVPAGVPPGAANPHSILKETASGAGG